MTQEISIHVLTSSIRDSLKSEVNFPELMTADELLKISDDGYRCELVKGELRKTPPAGSEHGVLTVRLAWRLAQHVEKYGLGLLFAAGTGFRIKIDPDTVRAPDTAFVRKEHIPPDTGIPEGYWDGTPDLAVEVISPGDTLKDSTLLTEEDELNGEDVIEDFQCRVAEIFV